MVLNVAVLTYRLTGICYRLTAEGMIVTDLSLLNTVI